MPSTISVSKLLSTLAIKAYDFDPNVTTVVKVAWVDMARFNAFAAGFFRTIGTSAITLKIFASAASDGSSPVEVKAWSGSQPDAVGDQVWLEVLAEEIANLGTHLRYVSAEVSFATDTDEGVVLYVRGEGDGAKNLTADIVA